MTTVVDWTVVAILTVWLGFTMRFHVPLRDNLPLRRKDLFGLVPDWRFFAPTPARHDYHLLFRDRLSDGAVTEWQEISIGRHRRWYGFLWNPHRRDRKALFDLTTELARVALDEGPDAVPGSISYLTLLTYVSDLPRWSPSVMTQFCILASDARANNLPPEPVLISDMHWL